MKSTKFEFYPRKVYKYLIKKQKKRLDFPPSMGGQPSQLVLDKLKLWPKKTLKVAFLSGDYNLHKKIKNVAQEWCKYGCLLYTSPSPRD